MRSKFTYYFSNHIFVSLLFIVYSNRQIDNPISRGHLVNDFVFGSEKSNDFLTSNAHNGESFRTIFFAFF